MGRCSKCGSGDITIDNAVYRCKDCGYIGSVREWLKIRYLTIIKYFNIMI